MWKIFKKGHSRKSDKRRTLAEKRHTSARKHAWKLNERKRKRELFFKHLKNFISNPFGRKSQTVSQHEEHIAFSDEDTSARAELRKIQAANRLNKAANKPLHRRNFRKEWERSLTRLRKKISGLFAKKKLSPLQREKRRIRRYKRRDRALARRKFWVQFKKNPYRYFFHGKKHQTADGGYQYVYKMSKAERKQIARLQRIKARETFKEVITTPELRRKFEISFLHSTAYFVLAFIFVYVIYQLVTIVMASSFHIPVVWYYYQLQFPLYTYSPLYTRAALILIFSVGPIISLMIGFVFLKMFFTKRSALKRFQLFYLWGFIAGINMFFGAYIAGFFTRTEFIYTSEWLFLSDVFDTEEIIFTVVSFTVLIIIGRAVTPLFMQSSGSVTIVKPQYRIYFFLSTAFLPWMAGMVILFLITLPRYYIPLIIKTITPGLVLLPILLLYNSSKFDNIHKSGVIQHTYFRWSVVIVVVALLFFYRIILEWGLKVL